MYKQGETVIVTENIDKKTKEQKHEVGVIMKAFVHKKQNFYDVLLERRSALSFLNTSIFLPLTLDGFTLTPNLFACLKV